MPNLDKIKDKALDKMVAQLKTWASAEDDESIKTFLSKNTKVRSLNKKQLRQEFADFVEEGDKADSAADDLDELMQEGERLLHVMLGTPSSDLKDSIPENVQGKRMTEKRARGYLEGWRLGAASGEPTCEMVCWTNQRIIWNKVGVGGASTVHSVPSMPTEKFPELP